MQKIAKSRKMKKSSNPKKTIKELRTAFEIHKHENYMEKEIIEIKYKFKDGASRRVITNPDGTFTVINKGPKT